MAQVDVFPSTQLGSGTQPNGIHFHGPRGESAASSTNPTEAPSIPANSSAAKTVSAKIAQANGGPRFQNPS